MNKRSPTSTTTTTTISCEYVLDWKSLPAIVLPSWRQIWISAQCSLSLRQLCIHCRVQSSTIRIFIFIVAARGTRRPTTVSHQQVCACVRSSLIIICAVVIMDDNKSWRYWHAVPASRSRQLISMNWYLLNVPEFDHSMHSMKYNRTIFFLILQLIM